VTLRSPLLAVPFLVLACSSPGSAHDVPDSGSEAQSEAATNATADAAHEAATDSAPGADGGADAGTPDPCAVYFAALASAQGMDAACVAEGGGSTFDAGNQPSLCETELGSTAYSASDRESFGNDVATLAACVSSLGECSASNESSWEASRSACFAAFGSGLAVSSACRQALYIAGF
jgi:hypothetical protein